MASGIVPAVQSAFPGNIGAGTDLIDASTEFAKMRACMDLQANREV